MKSTTGMNKKIYAYSWENKVGIRHFFILVFSLFLISGTHIAMGQGQNQPVSKELFNTIYHMDSVLFNAFNNRDLETLKSVFSTGLEFYHDTGGLTFYDQTIENSAKLFQQNNGLTRTLIPGSLEVYPIPDYGAIQIGTHRFCHLENGKDDCGTFKFVHVWKNDHGWKLTRVVSYGH